jgi:hypothetical protein
MKRWNAWVFREMQQYVLGEASQRPAQALGSSRAGKGEMQQKAHSVAP